MTTSISARQPAGIPSGGQFAPTTHTEPAVALGTFAHATPVPFQGSFDLKESEFGSLPQLPAAAGTPEVDFGFDIDGKLETRVTVGGSTMTFWFDEMNGEITNTVEAGYLTEDDMIPWGSLNTEDDLAQTRAWAESVHERIDGSTYHLLSDATGSEQTRRPIIEFAAGRSEPAAAPTPQQSSTQRAAAAMAICEDGQGADITMRDLLTDLRHYADAHGIDIYEAMDKSHGYYLHEKADPSFKEGY